MKRGSFIDRVHRMFGAADVVKGIAWGLVAGALVLATLHGGPERETPLARPSAAHEPSTIELSGVTASPDVLRLVRWLNDSGDAAGRPFFVIDKREATLYAFGADGKLRAHTPVLLGGARGDHTVPGIGERAIASILPAERTTPAGRFVGERGRNARGEDVVWVDYDAAVSMHRVLNEDPAERRLERLESASPADNRISFGCINVPPSFFDAHVLPLVPHAGVLVYILPEVRTFAEVFAVAERALAEDANGAALPVAPAPPTAARYDARAWPDAFADPWRLRPAMVAREGRV